MGKLIKCTAIPFDGDIVKYAERVEEAMNALVEAGYLASGSRDLFDGGRFIGSMVLSRKIDIVREGHPAQKADAHNFSGAPIPLQGIAADIMQLLDSQGGYSPSDIASVVNKHTNGLPVGELATIRAFASEAFDAHTQQHPTQEEKDFCDELAMLRAIIEALDERMKYAVS